MKQGCSDDLVPAGLSSVLQAARDSPTAPSCADAARARPITRPFGLFPPRLPVLGCVERVITGYLDPDKLRHLKKASLIFTLQGTLDN